MKEHCCAICGALLAEGSDPYVLYHSEKTDEESFACPECARLLRKLMEEEDAAALPDPLAELPEEPDDAPPELPQPANRLAASASDKDNA